MDGDLPEDFGDRDLDDTAERVRAVLAPTMTIHPEFSRRLRAELVAAAAEQIAAQHGTDRPGVRPVALPGGRAPERPAPVGSPVSGAIDLPRAVPARRPRRSERDDRSERQAGPRTVRRVAFAVASATTAAAAGAVLVTGGVPGVPGLPGLRPGGDVVVNASSELSGAVSADPAAGVRVTFDHPLDHASVLAALRITPAASLRTAWQGDTLTVTPVHGLAPNSAYRLTVDAHGARTAAGTSLASDVEVAFGTAPSAVRADAAPGSPVAAVLRRSVVAEAGASSEAVVTRSGALLLTGARAAAASGLVRMGSGTAQRVAAATDAICVSRSGSSVAYLGSAGGAAGPAVVFADAAGAPQHAVPVAVDAGSPLGWIDDEAVTYVSRGKLVAIDRKGGRRELWSRPVDPATQSVVIAPGGRYAYLGRAGDRGELVDLVAGTSRLLTGLVADPAFTADGAGVVWLDTAGGQVRLHVGAAAGGPVTTAVLAVTSRDRVRDVAVSPDGTRFVYTLTPAGGRAQLRLAALPTGATLATSDEGGESPNFAPAGGYLTVLAASGTGHRIETVQLPPSGLSGIGGRVAAAETVASAFATAQIGGDTGAQGWLARPGTVAPALPTSGVTRAEVVRAQARDDGTVAVIVRLTLDAGPGRPRPLEAEETLTVSGGSSGASGGAATHQEVTAVALEPFRVAPDGPRLLHAGMSGHQVRLQFDSDLDAASVAGGVRALSGSHPLAAAVRYDDATRTVTVDLPDARPSDEVRLSVQGLRDVAGAATPTADFTVRL